jgi:serine/threonine protein kinase
MNDQNLAAPTSPESPQVAHALKPGDTIMEYVIERTLGGGGFGITYLARDKNLNLPVAVKEYLPGELALRAADDSVHPLGDAFADQFKWGLERFLSEARVLATFRHPNIVRVLRYFIVNGTGYIVMEYESGESLKRWRPRQGILNQAALLKILYPLLDGLEVVHNADFLHRDIKPDNIYIRDADGSPVLIDFGSARSTTTDSDLTNIVSPGFAPFEQYHSKGKQGPWTDLYSLAAVMYWLISGTKPLDSLSRLKQDSMVSATQIDHHDLFDVSLLRAIDWALNPEETLRPQSVAEFRNRLLESIGDERTVASSNSQLIGLLNQQTGTLSSHITSGGDNPGSNLVCSILFLDIVAYSKTSVKEQYQLKSQFNQLIAGKLAHIPANSRITLDTGDGACICFMGDPEEVLHAAIAIRQALIKQDRLLVRMGLHIGPVRVIKDMNGHNNVVGDGINVAQRVMSFAESNTLVVSRAYYEIVARLTEGIEKSFISLGERRDKHDRVHELYLVSASDEIENQEDQSDKTVLLDEVNGEKTILLSDMPAEEAGSAKHLSLNEGFPFAHLGPFVLATEENPLALDEGLPPDMAEGVTDPMPMNFGKRIRAGILDASHLIDLCSANNYWWQLFLATLLAYIAGWFIAGAVWGVGAGLTFFVLGWINFMRLMNKFLAQNMSEEMDSQVTATGSRRNILANLIVVLPSILIVAFLWKVLPHRTQIPIDIAAIVVNPTLASIPAINPSVSSVPVIDKANTAQVANPVNTPVSVVNPPVASTAGIDKPNIVRTPVKKHSKRATTKRAAVVNVDETQASLNKANKMLEAKNYAAAISLANSVLKKHPENVQAKEILKQANTAQLSPSIWPR